MMNKESDEDLRLFDLKKSANEFNEAYKLFLNDPEEFDRRVKVCIEAEICKADPKIQDRLRGLQFQIDAKLARHKNPQMRLSEMITLFWEGVYKFNAVLKGEFPPVDRCRMAKILPFEPKKNI